MQLGQQSSHTSNAGSQVSPSTPGHIPPFDWEEFESRYEKALAEANEQEKALLEEFDHLVKVWPFRCTEPAVPLLTPCI